MNELLIPNKIIRCKRKSLSLIINNYGELIVRAPIKYKDSQIQEFINKKAHWIIEKRTNQAIIRYNPLLFNEQETITILEKAYSIVLYDGRLVKIKEDNILIPKTNSKDKLKAFLKRTAKKYLADRVAEIAQKFNFKYRSISISSAKTNWGSCSFQNRLHFTYKLLMCPVSVIYYVIIHELVHTQIKNHSKQYWQAVGLICPNYKQYERWLKENKGIVEII